LGIFSEANSFLASSGDLRVSSTNPRITTSNRPLLVADTCSRIEHQSFSQALFGALTERRTFS